MFWNEDRIKWYLLASEYTGYHDNMALEIKKVVPKGESLFDFGCGLGLLPIKLSDHFSDIVGVDYDEHVLELLEKSIAKNKINNFKTILSNCYNGEIIEKIGKKDNILLSHFGNIEDYFYNFYNLFSKRMIIIRNDVENEIVHNSNKNTIQDICKFLNDRKVPYKIYRQTFEFGQPLKDDKEVMKYLEKWYGEKGINLISNVKDINYNYNGEIFTKYYCKPKNTAIVIVEKEDIWKKLKEFWHFV